LTFFRSVLFLGSILNKRTITRPYSEQEELITRPWSEPEEFTYSCLFWTRRIR